MGVLTKSQKEEISEIIKMVNTATFAEESFMNEIAEKIFAKMEIKINNITKPLTDKIKELEETNEELLSKMDSLEQYSRRQCLRFYGVVEDKKEDVETKVLDVIKNKLNLSEITSMHIDRCHRSGKTPDASDQKRSKNKSRPILVKFVSYKQRQLIYRNKKLLKATGIVIREDLTKVRLSLLHNVIEKFGYQNVWTEDGTIYYNHNNRKFAIRTSKDFDKSSN